jgi:uncharacterized repeat protein (TIGR04076 family)
MCLGGYMKFHTCKVTVIKRSLNKDLVDSYLQEDQVFPICDIVSDNQEFIVSNPYAMPEGICASAWADIRPYIISIASGGEFNFMKDKNVSIATCTDPFRPVIFRIERIN